MSSLRFALNCTVFGVLAFTPVLSHADPLDDHLSARAEVSVKGGSDRSLLTTEFWAPLAQQSGRVVYTDLRLMGDDNDNREGNLGIGYRQVTDWSSSVLGAHAWIDRRRTEHNATFHQVTVGVESLGKVIDLRANGYIALNDAKVTTTPSTGPIGPYLLGSGLFYNTNSSISETPQHGLDGEIGYRLPLLQRYTDTIRVYGGGYHFFRENTESTTGYRVRTEAVINPVLSVGARFQHDGERGSQTFLEATLRFPFSAKKLYQQKGLYARLDESPERDVDIVTANKVDSGQRQILNQTSGEAQRILYVDNSTANGDGTIEKPFNNLQSAQAALQANDILYVRSGTGTTQGMDQGITISQPNVQLIGSGSPLTIQGITFIGAGAAPVITNNQSFVNDGVGTPTNFYGSAGLTGNGVMVTADNASISGLTIQNVTGSGVYVSANPGQVINNITVNNNTIYGSINGSGVQARALDGGIIRNVSIHDNNMNENRAGAASGVNRGIQVIAIGNGSHFDNVLIQNNTILSNQNVNAIELKVAGGSVDDAVISGNYTETIATNAYANITVNTDINTVVALPNQYGGTINNVTIDNNTSLLSGNYGINISQSTTGSRINNLNITNNTSSANSNDGLYVSLATNASMGTLNINNNTINANRARGFNLRTVSGGAVQQVNIQNLTVIGSTLSGLAVTSDGAGSRFDNIVASNINATNNLSAGISISASNGAAISQVSLSNSVTSNNATMGVYFNANGSNATFGTVTVSGVVTNNNAYGIRSFIQNSGQFNTLNISNNIVSNNTTNGGIVISTANANSNLSVLNISDNTVTNSSNAGVSVFADSASHVGVITVSNNTSSNNQTTNGVGILVQSNATGTLIDTVTINNNITSNNAARGINNSATNGAQTSNVFITNNTSSRNASYGISSGSGGTGSLVSNVTVSGNTANNNGDIGILVSSTGSSVTTNAIITNNTTNNNTGSNGYGLQVYTANSGLVSNSTVSGNTANNNALGGFSYITGTTSALSSSFYNNNAIGNGTYGLVLFKSGSGTFVVDAGGGSLGSIGYNRIFGNIGTTVRVDGGYALKAQTNYWGGGAPTTTLNGGSTIDTAGFLVNDPR